MLHCLVIRTTVLTVNPGSFGSVSSLILCGDSERDVGLVGCEKE